MDKQNPTSKIIEVTIEHNFDLLSKGWESRIFLKLYLSLRTSGLLGTISDKDLKTLITLATFMDEQGRCYPSQECLAKSLNLTQAGVAKRMKSLLAFRWQGKPLVSAQKVRNNDGRFENTVYTILPESSLAIFSGNSGSHMPVGHMADGHADHNHEDNNNTVTEISKCESTGSKSSVDPLALQLAREMGDLKSLAYYRRVVKRVNPGILLRVRGEVLEEKNIKKCRGAMFAYLVNKYAAQKGMSGAVIAGSGIKSPVAIDYS
jgi:hypothetical protein